MAETPTLLGARLQRLSSERARKIERLRREEWAFDKNMTAEYVTGLKLLREEIGNIEGRIAYYHNLQKMMAEVDVDSRDDLDRRTIVLPSKRTLPVQRIGEKR